MIVNYWILIVGCVVVGMVLFVVLMFVVVMWEVWVQDVGKNEVLGVIVGGGEIIMKVLVLWFKNGSKMDVYVVGSDFI